ncbi:hypothetical protein DNTS_002688 [Danionella cerebrum]|uniref:Kit ligand n=1 Tax=Danionella cerebrum TaxID=2873325 RepID=A0A553NKS7_9TELE|nr:hypothetical protein DNTS_002688 [Danionella translucida]
MEFLLWNRMWSSPRELFPPLARFSRQSSCIIWICTCVHLLLYITVAAYSSEIGNPITDDIKKISLLKQNIPKDYNITVHYIPKEVSGMCWVRLNVFNLEMSLKALAQQFGNISSNKDNIGTFVQILQEMRYHIGHDLEDLMQEFDCHRVEKMWLTAKYFEFVEDFFNTANSSRNARDCEPPPCPTSTKTTVTRTTTASTTSVQHSTNERRNVWPDDPGKGAFLSKVLESNLMWLLTIPFAIAVVVLFAWKIKSRRNASRSERRDEGPALFSGEEANAPPLDVEISEKRKNDRTQAKHHLEMISSCDGGLKTKHSLFSTTAEPFWVETIAPSENFMLFHTSLASKKRLCRRNLMGTRTKATCCLDSPGDVS